MEKQCDVKRNWLKEIIGYRKPTMAEISRRTGIPYSTLYNWTSGKVQAPYEGVKRVLNELGYEIRIVKIDQEEK